MPSFCRKTYVHKIPRFRGGILGLGGGSADFIFMGAGILLTIGEDRQSYNLGDVADYVHVSELQTHQNYTAPFE